MQDNPKQTLARHIVDKIRQFIRPPDEGPEWLTSHVAEFVKLETGCQDPETIQYVKCMLRAKWWPINSHRGTK